MNSGVIIPEISPTSAQSRAIAEIKDWYVNRSKDQQVFRLFGYAGTGKTTLTKYAISDLGLSMFKPPKKQRKEFDLGAYSKVAPKAMPWHIDDESDYSPNELIAYRGDDPDRPIPDVYFMAFTGKASLVMERSGTPAQTIHSTIMNVFEATDEQIEMAERKLIELRQMAETRSGDERIMAYAAAVAFYQNLERMKKPGWSLDPEADIGHTKLIVMDEVSMVDEELAGYVMSFGIPILVIGDPGQLPPIKGEGAFTSQEPDVMLEEIHRQALESPIIRLATMARMGQRIPMGFYGDKVAKMDRLKISTDQLLRADQVICGLNVTRYQLNAAMRNRLGFYQLAVDKHNFGALPSGENLPDAYGVMRPEKIICLKNDSPQHLVNGMFIEIENIKSMMDNEKFEARIITEDGTIIQRTQCYAGAFINHYEFDKDRESREWKSRKYSVQSTYGWAITCHKAQGSQYKNVILYDDRWGRGADQRRKWLYTGITRAEEGLVILE